MMYSRSSFLKGKYVYVGEVWWHEVNQTPRRLTLFSDEQVTEASSFPLSSGIGGTDRNPYMEVGEQFHNSIGGFQQEPRSFYTEEASRWPLLLKPSSMEDGWGKIKLLG
jgi:hypothetical protein